MNIQDWGAVGELLGSLAVLITLIYLSLQVRQAREFAVRESESHLADQMADHIYHYVENPDLGRIVELANTDHQNLSEEETRVAMWFQLHYLFMVEGLFRRRAAGLLDQEVWTPYERILAGVVSTAFFNEHWKTNKSMFTDAFGAYIDGLELGDWKLGEIDSIVNQE